MAINGIVVRAAGDSPETSISTSPMVLAGSRQRLPAGYIHLGVAKEIASTLRDFGLDPDPIIRAAGLDPRLFDDETNVIAFAALGRLYTLCVARTNCLHFGLLVGRRAGILSLGLVGRLMQHSETVGDAMRVLVSSLSIQDRAVVPALTISDGTAVLTFAIYQTESKSTEQILDASLCAFVNILRSLCGSSWNPSEVLLPRTAPADVDPFRRHICAPALFNQEIAAIVLPARDLDLRIAGADPMLRAVLEERIQKMKVPSRCEFADDLRRLLRTRLTSHDCSAEDIADLLAMHRRTLTRRLSADGLDYRTIANEIRFEIARQLLDDTEVPLGQISAALGYSEAGAFTRAFRRWSGQTPTAWRNRSDTDDELWALT